MRIYRHNADVLNLSQKQETHYYTAEISNKIIQGKETIYSAIGLEFSLTFLSADTKGLLNYQIDIQKRLFLNERFNIIKRLNKAQRIAQAVASINDKLIVQTNKEFKLIKVLNTTKIRQKWQLVKDTLLKEFPDLRKMADDFSLQLKEPAIQRFFLADNFFNFFFANIFSKNLERQGRITASKVLATALGNITIPIIEEKKLEEQATKEVLITLKAELDTEGKDFPLNALNDFLGKLASSGEQHSLDFNYMGAYKLSPTKDLVTQGDLTYIFEIKDLYKKTTTITFNLQKDEQ